MLQKLTGSFSPLLKKIIFNSGWLFADKLARFGIGLIVWLLVARYLGPEKYGYLSYAIALVGLLTPIAILGLENLVVRDLVTEKDKNQQILGTAFVMRLAGAFLVFFLSLILVLILRPGESFTLLLVFIIAFGPLFQAFDVIEYWFQSEVLSRYTVIAKNAAFVLSSAIKLYLIYVKAPLEYFAFITTLELLLGASGLIFVYKKRGYSLKKWKFKKERFYEFIKECIPLTISGSAILIYMRADIIILGQLSGEHAVGLYTAAARISEIFYVIAVVIGTSVFPVLIKDEGVYTERLYKLFNVMTAAAYIFIAVALLFFPLILMLLGSQYEGSESILAVHIWSIIFVYLGVAQASWYIKEKASGLYMQLRRTIIGAVINVGLNFILIPYWGGLSATITTLISYIYVNYLCNLFSKRTRDIFYMQTKSLLLLGFIWPKKS